jgi:hypothetical protein
MIFFKWKGYKTLKDVDGSDVVELVREHHLNLIFLDTQLVKFSA